MPFTDILLLAVSLAFDAFAVSIGCGSNGSLRSRRESIRLASHFGIFQFLMPILGWLLGYSVSSYLQSSDHWIALGLLAVIGGKMIKESFEHEEKIPMNAAKGWTMVMLSVATSIDALAIGLTLALLKINVFYPSFIIGVVTAALSLVGVFLGKKLGEKLGKRMEFIGGLILIFIGLRICYAHIFIGG